MKKAHKIKDVSDQFTGEAFVYRCDPPLNNYQYIVASATDLYHINPTIETTRRLPLDISQYETYIFGCDKFGKVSCWSEQKGSATGIYNCDEALKNAGYEVIDELE